MSRTNMGLLACGIGALLGCAVAAPAGEPVILDSDITIEPVVTGLNFPTSMGFIGRDDFLICQKNSGQVVRVTGGQIAGVVLDLPVNFDVYRGLLGLAVDPRFWSNGFVYLYYSRAEQDGGPWLENRVARFRWDGQRLDPASETVLVSFTADSDQSNRSGCEGGTLTFGPDGKLYGTVGDLTRGGFDNPRIEMNTGTDEAANAGGIFRLNTDGTIPADNPFANHPVAALHKMYTYGMRDSFGLSFDPRNGTLWQAENGPDAYDEVNRAFAGWNSGWLKIMGPDSRNATYERNLFTAYDAIDLTQLPGAVYADPKFSFAQPVGVSALAFVPEHYFPHHLRGRLLLGDANFGHLYLFALTEDRVDIDLPGMVFDGVADTPEERDAVAWGDGFGITSGLHLGPDGFLYQVEFLSGTVRRIRPTWSIGDLNGDGTIDNGDIDAFVLALTDRAGYEQQYPLMDADTVGDMDGDGTLNSFDIDGFVAELVR